MHVPGGSVTPERVFSLRKRMDPRRACKLTYVHANLKFGSRKVNEQAARRTQGRKRKLDSMFEETAREAEDEQESSEEDADVNYVVEYHEGSDDDDDNDEAYIPLSDINFDRLESDLSSELSYFLNINLDNYEFDNREEELQDEESDDEMN